MDSEDVLPDRDELLRNLADARFDRGISVAAVKCLLEELRREDVVPAGSELDVLDDNVTPIRRAG